MASHRLISLSRLLTTTAKTTVFRRSITTSSTARFSLLRTISAVNIPTSNAKLALPSSFRSFSTQNSMNDNNNSGSNRPPKETILLDGCDFEHWLVVVDPPPEDWTRDMIIDDYIKTLADVIGSEDEARRKIYSVSTKHYFAFGALVSEEISYKLKEIEKIRWVLPDSYLDVKNKDYGGEPFIDGQAVPYDPKYHEEWVRNNQKARERNNRPDRPRNADRSRNFDRRQRSPEGNMGGGPPQHGGPPAQYGGPPNAERNMGGAPTHRGGPPNNPGYNQNPTNGPPRPYQQNMLPANTGYQQNMPPNNPGYQQNMPPPPNAGYQQNMPPPPNAGFQQHNAAGYQQNMPPPNAGFQQNMPPPPPNMPLPPPNNMGGNYGGQGNPGYGNVPPPNYQAGAYQNNAQGGGQPNYAPNAGFQTQNVPGRD